MTTFRRLLGFLRPYRRDVILSLVFAWAAMGMTVLIPFLVGQTVNAIESHDTGAFLPLAAGIIAAALLRLGLTFFRRLVAGGGGGSGADGPRGGVFPPPPRPPLAVFFRGDNRGRV